MLSTNEILSLVEFMPSCFEAAPGESCVVIYTKVNMAYITLVAERNGGFFESYWDLMLTDGTEDKSYHRCENLGDEAFKIIAEHLGVTYNE